MPPGKFSSSGLTDGRSDDDSVGGSYLPSAFVGQLVGVDQVNDVWIGDSGATTHMTRSAELMYDTRPPSPHRSKNYKSFNKKAYYKLGTLSFQSHSKYYLAYLSTNQLMVTTWGFSDP